VSIDEYAYFDKRSSGAINLKIKNIKMAGIESGIEV
jgi:hypothetical protein